jgi:hypothetical protein
MIQRLIVVPLEGESFEVVPTGYDRVLTEKTRPKDSPYMKVFHWAYLAVKRGDATVGGFDEWLKTISNVTAAEDVDPTPTEAGDDSSPL